MKKICPHCKKEIEYENHQQFGGHVTNCKDNPKREEMYEKIKKDKNKKYRKDYILKCENCNNDYEINITINNYNELHTS